MNDPVLFYAANAALSCVLLLGALEKARDMAAFTAAVSAYGMLPQHLNAAFARAFALAEIAAGILLLMPGWQRMGAALALLVLVVATAGLVYNLARGHRDIDCGCGGPAMRGAGTSRTGLSWWLVMRNGGLALWAAPALLFIAGQSRPLQWVDAAAVFGLTTTAVALYFTANHLLASHLKLRNL